VRFGGFHVFCWLLRGAGFLHRSADHTLTTSHALAKELLAHGAGSGEPLRLSLAQGCIRLSLESAPALALLRPKHNRAGSLGKTPKADLAPLAWEATWRGIFGW